MFDRFSERARKVMSLSRQEAQRLNSEFICTEHMLLGLINEGGGVAVKVMKTLGLNLDEIKKEVEKRRAGGTVRSYDGQIPFSPRTKRIIELAGEAASQLGHDVIGTEHLLLGLIKENDGIAAMILIENGVKLDEVRDTVLDALGGIEVSLEVPKYVVQLSKGLDADNIESALSAIRMIKGVEVVEVAGKAYDEDVVKSINDVTKSLLDVASKLEKIAGGSKTNDERGCV